MNTESRKVESIEFNENDPRRNGRRGKLFRLMKYAPPLVFAVTACAAGLAAYWLIAEKSPFTDEKSMSGAAPQERLAAVPDAEVVTLPILLVRRTSPHTNGHLKVQLAVEISPADQSLIEAYTPQLIDMMNGFLPEVTDAELRGGAALKRLRWEMRRRFNLILGRDAVKHVLILELLVGGDNG